MYIYTVLYVYCIVSNSTIVHRVHSIYIVTVLDVHVIYLYSILSNSTIVHTLHSI